MFHVKHYPFLSETHLNNIMSYRRKSYEKIYAAARFRALHLNCAGFRAVHADRLGFHVESRQNSSPRFDVGSILFMQCINYRFNNFDYALDFTTEKKAKIKRLRFPGALSFIISNINTSNGRPIVSAFSKSLAIVGFLHCLFTAYD